MQCGCGVDLPGRRRVCDDCKKLPPADRLSRSAGSSGEESEGAEAEVPGGLRARGRNLWVALGETAGTAHGVIALEACRIADRLDELDRIIAGEGVLDLLRFRLNPSWWDDDGEHVMVEVKFGNVLSTAAQQQVTMRNLIGALDLEHATRRRKGKSGAASVSTGQPAPKKQTPLDELGARRRQGKRK